MASLNILNKVEDYGNRLISLLNSHVKYYKIAAFEQVMTVLSLFISKAILLLTLLISSLFFSVWLAFYIGELLEKPSFGFLVVGFINLLIGMIVYLNRGKWIIDPIVHELAKLISKEDKENQDYEGTK
ncbi:MAG: hypothetical protein ACPGEG_10295 [Salibacteraceae bacterium]